MHFQRLGKMVVASSKDGFPITADDLVSNFSIFLAVMMLLDFIPLQLFAVRLDIGIIAIL